MVKPRLRGRLRGHSMARRLLYPPAIPVQESANEESIIPGSPRARAISCGIGPSRRLGRLYKVRPRFDADMNRTHAPAGTGDQPPRLGGPAGALHGALGGIYGAAAMSILRLAAHRAGLIDKMLPQVVEEWTLDRTGMKPSPASKTAHHVLDQFLHLGYGAAMGAVCGSCLVLSRLVEASGSAALWVSPYGPGRPWCCSPRPAP
jgi:hypothetical protein